MTVGEKDALLYATPYGGFAPDGRSYVVTSPDAPRDWFNLLTNRDYCAFARTSGRGRSFYKSPELNMVVPENRTFFVRDADSGEYWSPTGYPARREIKDFSCVHEPACTTITSTYRSIRTELQVFVPLEGNYELWRITLENLGKTPRKLSLFACYPMLVWNFRWFLSQYNVGRYDPKLGAIITTTSCNQSPPKLKYTGVAASLPHPTAWTSSELAFVRAGRSWGNPASVEGGRLPNVTGSSEPLVSAFQFDVNIPAGKKREIYIMMGVADDRKEAASMIRRNLSAKKYDTELAKVRQWWSGHLDQPLVDTPDGELNLMTNTWMRRQFVVQVLTQRSASGGANARNIIQDVMGYLPFDASFCRQRLIDACRFQYAGGLIPMDWPKDESVDMEGRSKYLDAPLWIAVTLADYIRETGDWALLDQQVPYRQEAGLPPRSDSVLNHIVASLKYVAAQRGAHGLILFGGGDWNDPLQAGPAGKGESSWTTEGLIWAINETVPLLRRLAPTGGRTAGNVAVANELEATASELAAALNEHCWDGKWYSRGFTDAGRRFGTAKEREGRVYLNVQSWAVLSGAAPADRAATAMKSADKVCGTACGLATVAPAYTKYVPDLGRLTNKLPGCTENGSVYNHSVTFNVYAKCRLGWGDAAWRALQQILPTVRQHPVEKSLHTPMWMPNAYEPPCSYAPGRATDLYQTGTIPWFFKSVMEGLLGVRATFDGLEIDPCLPRHWKTAGITRRFRGGEFRIRIHNPLGLQKGAVRITVDNKPIEGSIIPVMSGVHEVDVIMTNAK